MELVLYKHRKLKSPQASRTRGFIATDALLAATEAIDFPRAKGSGE